MPIGEQTTIASHTGNGVATVFAYSFGVLAADDIKVLVDGIEVTTGFTVSGIGSRTGGTVTFSVAPANGADILIVREVVRKRDTDYQYSGDLRQEVLDDDLDRIWMTLQEDGELVDRGVRVPVGETLPELPAAASRVDKVLTFGPGGAIALVDIAAFSGGGVVELVPADGSIALVKLTPAVQALINGALQKSGGTMTGKIVLDGDATLALHPVPKQQAESIADAAAAAAAAAAVSNRFQFSQTLEVATTSGSVIDINDLPAWTKRLTITFGGTSITTTGAIGIQLGTASGFETSGYNCVYVGIVSGSYGFASTTGAIFRTDISGGANQLFATVVMNLHGSNSWQAPASGYRAGDGAMALSYGQIDLPAALTRIRLSTSQPFDGGSVSVLCEG